MNFLKNFLTISLQLAIFGFAIAVSKPSNAASLTLANSVSEFSGTQGQDNWYYGYYNGSFTSDDFQQMTQYDNDAWWVKKGAYWSNLWNNGGHPNGNPSIGDRIPVNQWSVRRWISEVDGEIQIMGNLSKSNTVGVGIDGIIGSIFVNGLPIWSSYIAPHDGYGVNYNLSTTITKGSFVDWAIAPYGNDGSDGTNFTATINRNSDAEPVPEPFSGLGLLTSSVLITAFRIKRQQRIKAMNDSNK